MARTHDVLIVGAGMAGLACARRLAEASVDFLVLEASSRIGGRVLSDYGLAGRAVELGALMIHGRHVVSHRWVEESGLHARRLPVIQRARFVRDGRVSRFPALALPFHPTFGLRAFYQGVYGIPRSLSRYRGPDMSLARFLDEARALPGARSLVTLLRAHAAAAEASEIGVLGPSEEEAAASEEFGYSNFQILEGYTELAKRRSAGMEDRIRVGRKAVAIRRSGGGVRMEAIGPDGGLEEFGGKRAVVTLPLGVLKAETVAFDPPLPDEKREAIRRIGFGDALVVQLRLGGGNLGRRLGDFGILWGETASTFHRPFVALRGSPDVLTAFTVGWAARQRHALEDAELVSETLEELRSILPSGVDPGTPEAWAIGRWTSDPHVRGGYSFLPPDAGLAHRRALAAPVDGVIFFAGEATHHGGEAATVHGAIETGHRAADEVLRSLRTP